MRSLWKWLVRHIVMLPEPEQTRERQVDPSGVAVGVRVWFFTSRREGAMEIIAKMFGLFGIGRVPFMAWLTPDRITTFTGFLKGLLVVLATATQAGFDPTNPIMLCALLYAVATYVQGYWTNKRHQDDDAQKATSNPTAGVSMLLVVGIAGMLVACSAAQIQKEREIVAKIKADGKTLIITGCGDLPAIEVLASMVPEFYPPAAVAITIGEKFAESFCEKVKAAQSIVLPT